MPASHYGRHEFGQNFLTDRDTIDHVICLVRRTDGPIIEIGCGDGALTLPLLALGRRLTGIEIDARLVRRLRPRLDHSAWIVPGDFLTYRLPAAPHVVVGSLPFHQTTAMLRRILRAPHWTSAVLLVQWEVARRRAGVGGASMMTAQWWPWYEFALGRRVPAAAFQPRPGVDGGVLLVTRRAEPLVDASVRRRYQSVVHRIFTGRGRGLLQVVRFAFPSVPRLPVSRWARRNNIGARTLPKDLTAGQWAELFDLITRQ